ncbi:MAG: hypothetical protein AMXMBFR33_12320 [Candidatus Xenobia bacterium]
MLDLLRDLPGWMVMSLTFALPVLFAPIRRSQSLLLAIWFTLGLHHAAAIVNCYLFLLPGAEEDARAMDATAMGADYVHLLRNPYVLMLRAFYQSFGRSHLLGCELSVLAYSASVVVLVYLIRYLGSERWQAPMVLLFGSLPGAVFNCSVTLRESYQTLGILLVIWCLVQVREGRPWYYLGMLVCVVALAQLHNGLALFSLGVTAVSVIWGLRGSSAVAGLLIILVVLGALWQRARILDALAQHSAAVNSLAQGRLIQDAASYRDFQAQDRATYRARLDTSSVFGFLTTFPRVLFLYMFSPLPWQARGLKDLYAVAESLLRMALCLGALVNVRQSSRERRVKLLGVLIFFLTLEALWSIGTGNWGQAIRHRVVGWGLLVICGAEPWLKLASSGRRRGARKVAQPSPPSPEPALAS